MGDRIRIAYILKEFPKISETFILNEILELEHLGFEVTIFTRKSASKFPPHNDFFVLRGIFYFLPRMIPGIGFRFLWIISWFSWPGLSPGSKSLGK
jgi:hypothetical protein